MFTVRLRWREVVLLGRMAGLLGVLHVARRRWSLPALVQWFGEGEREAAPVAPQRLLRLCRALLGRLYSRDYCLPQSLLMFYFLRKWGYPARIHFGVARNAERRLVGHAWVDVAGQPLGETRDPEAVYATTYTYPSTTSVSIT